MSSQQSSDQPDSEPRQDTEQATDVNESELHPPVDSPGDIEEEGDASRGCSILDGCALWLSHE